MYEILGYVIVLWLIHKTIKLSQCKLDFEVDYRRNRGL